MDQIEKLTLCRCELVCSNVCAFMSLSPYEWHIVKIPKTTKTKNLNDLLDLDLDCTICI